MTIQELYNLLEERYPRHLSCTWDNDGIMVCQNPDKLVEKVLVALDVTMPVIAYAAAHGYSLIVSHHPCIFRGIRSLQPQNAKGRQLLSILAGGISVFSFHTRLDAAEGGVNDALCTALGYTADGVFGDQDAPTLGRLFTLETPVTAGEMAKRIQQSLGCPMVRINGDTNALVNRVAVCGGDGKDFIYPALAAGADLFLTGDAGYNMAAEAAEDGIVTVEAGHYHTEAPVCAALAQVIRDLSGAAVSVMDSCSYTVIN